MSLTADPPNGSVAAGGGTLTHNLVNSGAEKLVFKVKSSNNTEYRVKPVFGFVDPGASTPLEITRLAGPAKEDKMVVQFAPAPADASDPQAAFTAVGNPAGNVTIPISAT
ncbi:Major Sperm protein Domain containing [Trichostrongylus colubriformis]|uniref:Major Sperm protein Domain containing n=1 Tax=Trichostrongylus colubriformis TaxID=6319 RepID=A0AAN8G3I6_TRICO